MHVLFVEPRFPANQRSSSAACTPSAPASPASARRRSRPSGRSSRAGSTATSRSPSVVDEGAMLDAVRRVQAREWVDRLEATVEAHILPVAQVREAAGIPGTTVRDRLPVPRQAGDEGGPAPRRGRHCAASDGVSSPEEARAFAARVGYPIILKPRSGAGAAGTERIGSDEELEAAIRAHGIDRGALGRGRGVHRRARGLLRHPDGGRRGGARVHLALLPGRARGDAHRWISPYVITTNRIDAPGYDEVRRMGRKVIRELGIGTSATPHGVVLRPQGTQVLGDRLPPAGGLGLGPLQRRQRFRPLPRVGR